MTGLKSNTCLRFILPIFFLIVFSAGAAGQEHSYDIKNYDLTIEPDFATKTIFLKASVEIANPGLIRAFSFGLNDRYDLVKATSDVSEAMVERSPGYVTVVVDKPETQMQLNLELSGALGKSGDEDRDVVADSSLFLLWSDRFYPIDFDDWATVTTTIVLPSDFQAVAPGRLMTSHKTKNKIEYVFRTSTPTVCFSVIADSRWIMSEDKIRFLRMQTFVYPESQRFVGQIFSTSYDVISSYSQMYCLYPYDQFTVVTIRDIKGRRAFPGFVAYSPQCLEKEFTTTGHDAHETAFLWWGYTARGSGPGGFQWTEGLGDYAEFLYEEAHGKSMSGVLESLRDKYLALPAEQDVPYYELREDTPQELIHGRYPWLMRLVRYAVGDKAFKKAAGQLFYKFRFHTFSMDEFVSTLEEGCGQSLKWWRDEWLERTGVPTISLRSETVSDKGQYRVTVLLKQIGNIYHLPIEIGIETKKGLRIEKVNLSEREASFTFKSAEAPVKVVLDPNDWVLMKKVYQE